jgi:hypothetical protein
MSVRLSQVMMGPTRNQKILKKIEIQNKNEINELNKKEEYKKIVGFFDDFEDFNNEQIKSRAAIFEKEQTDLDCTGQEIGISKFKNLETKSINFHP